MSDEDTKTYLLIMKDGQRKKITVPAGWKCTFGPVAPGSRNHNGRESMCLRLYESKEKQRAVFTDVAEFRDASIPVKERVVHVRDERAHRETPDGIKHFNVQARYAEWRDENDEPSNFEEAPKLPSIDDDDL